jgi:uncharacterized protein YbaR (Trm112 family)
MIEPKLVAVLRCPKTGQRLEVAENTLVQRVNAAIQKGQLRDHQEQRIGEAIGGGLVTSDGMRLYPIRNQIPTMIVDESIPLQQLNESGKGVRYP